MKIGHIDDDKCECGEPETVEHVLTECPLLQQLRSTLHNKIGDKSRSLPLMLGGRPQPQPQPQGPLPQLQPVSPNNNKEHWRITSTELNAVLDFAEDSQRFARKEEAGD